ncbi:n-acetylglutamate synthase [Paenibacillus sp. PR3]|uniref:N-acetylglutamate synthase n=1 Tax=Paenibacillus terricola TaxID=2763503 RepID=A0ABR8N1X4_9BACL|nr:n-acetylglutamate synthase [Paenibacillus terricola]
MNYHGRRFRTVSNTNNGEVNEETVFLYFQKEDRVWAEYEGGGIVKGHLIAIVNQAGELDMRYHHLNEQGERMTGICKSTPEWMDNGKLRLHEQWEWTCKDRSSGRSIIEEL